MLRKGTYVLVGILLITASGCFPAADPRTSNQGGGSIISVGLKLAQQNIGDLNADEWQILTDSAPTIAAQYNVDLGAISELTELSDEQAAAIVQFLDDNSIQTIDDLEQLAQQIEAGTIQVPQILVDMGVDLFT